MGKSTIRLLSVILIIAVLWKPAESRAKCSIECKGSPSSPGFVAGTKYSYGVEGIVSIYLSAAEGQETSVKMLGQVTVDALANCVNELTVQNLVLSGPDGKKYQPPPGIDKVVRFGFQDGRVAPEICAHEEDTRRSLNIKRAIISLLQTEQKPSTQVDVFGVCPTEVSSSQEGSAVLVHRTRDLSRCSHREQGKNDIIVSITNPDSGLNDLQVLQSILNVESKVNNGVPEKVSATEEYLYKPFSVGDNGARAKVHTKLTLTSKSGCGEGVAYCTEPRSIIFDNPHGVKPIPGNANSVLASVKEVAKTVQTVVGAKSAGSFAHLIRVLRITSKEDLMKVFSQVKGNNLEKRVFLDALLRAGTGESIEASIAIMKSRELGQVEQQLVFLSLGNARHVNNAALKAAAGLLDQPNLPKEVYLGAGALAGAYCREHECHATKPEGIVALSQKLGAKLQNCRPKTKPEEDTAVAILKGIRNIRHLEDSLISKVVHCAVDNNVKPRVRAAALEAFHADPCSSKIKKTAIDLMKNRQLDSEIRIKAYLAVIECPDGHSANEIKNLLDTEPVHQVGNFISTSLRHIRASTNPDKQLARKHYGLIRTPNKFNSDERKYSFYHEMSYNIDALGAGGSVDQTVIYSQDSFLPRSVNFNLTVELFGHSYNILELGGRQGNLDRVIEHFLGPKGYFRSEDPQTLYDNLAKRYEESKNKVEHNFARGRRSIKSEIDSFDKNLKAEANSYNNELDLDIYVKLFGTDAVFLSFGDDKGYDFNKILDQFLGSCNSGINQMKHFQQELRTHLLFLDAQLAYPTSTGLPLRLHLVGSAAARLDIATNVDIRQIMQSPQNAKVDVKFVPSSDIEIAGALLVDADAVTTGLKVVTELRSSTGVHVIAKVIENGRGFDLQIGLPVDKQEVIVASNDLIYVTAEKGQKEKQTKIKLVQNMKDYSGCFDQLSTVLGLTMCGQLSVPFSLSNRDVSSDEVLSQFFSQFPLSGSAYGKVVLEKNDLRGYHVKAVVREDASAGKRSFEFLFDAEGSQNRRTQLTGQYVFNSNEIGVKLELQSPIKSLYGEISACNNPREVMAKYVGRVDTQEYKGRIGFTVQGNEQRAVYKPVFEYSIPDGSGQTHSAEIAGEVIRETSGRKTKYTANGFKIPMAKSQQPVEVNGFVSLQDQPREVEVDLNIKDYASLKGSLKGCDVALDFENRLNPNINFKLKGRFDYTGMIHNEFDLQYGPNKNDPTSKIIFYQHLKYHMKSSEDYNIITKNSFEVRSVPMKIMANADVDPKKAVIEIGGQYSDTSAKFDMEARTQMKKPGDYSVKVKTNVNDDCLEVFLKRDVVSADKSNLENYVDIKGVGRYELSGVVLHKTKPNDVNVGAIGHFKIMAGSKSEDIKFDIGGIETPNLYSSHAQISGSKGSILDFLFKVTRSANPSGQLKFILKDVIAANGQFKVTDHDGKGNGMLIIDFKKLQRKLKADVKFVTKAPIYNVDLEFYLDFEKDNKNKLHFVSNNKETEKLVYSKNKLEYDGKRTEVNYNQEGVVSVNGKMNINLEVVLPTERCINLKIDREGATKDGKYSGHADIMLSDSAKRGSASSVISYKGKMVDTNIDKDIINYEAQIEFRLKDGKQLLNTISLKNIPEGDKFKFDFASDVTGNLLPKPASLKISGKYLDSDTVINENYRMKGSYGDDMGFEVVSVSDVNLFEKGDKKYLDDSTITIHLPFEKAHDIKWISTVQYLQPENQEIIEYTVVESIQINADVYKVDSNGKLGLKNGNGALKLLVPHNDPFMLDYNYKRDSQGDRSKNFVEMKAKYGKGKTASIAVDSTYAPHDSTLHVKANAPSAEKFKKLEFTVHSKNPSPDTYSNSVIMDADGRVYKSESTIVLSKAHPVLDLKYVNPETNKQSRIYVKGSSLSSTQGKVEVKVDNVYDVCFDVVSEGNIQKDNVAFKVLANSKELGWKNYDVDISSKDTGNGKRLEFHAINDNKNVLSGSTSFISRQEGQKTIIEGSGSVKLREEQKSANFKFIRTVLTESSEQGVETFFNIGIGERSYVAESRVTNFEYKNSYVYCEEKKQCAHAEIQSKIDMTNPGVIVNVVNIVFDLRKLGVAPEFGLQMRDEVSSTKPPRFTLDVHVNNQDRKYHLHSYNTPEHGHLASGVTVSLPSRLLALEYTLSYPTDKTAPFPITGEVCLDLDKKRPGHKTSARFLVDFSSAGGNQDTAVAEIGFSHPKIEKEAVFTVKGVMKRPGDGTFKFETSATLSCHSAFGADRVSKLLVEVSPNKFEFLAETPVVRVLHIDAGFTSSPQQKTYQSLFKICLLEGKVVKLQTLVKEFEYFEFTTEEADRKLSMVAHIVPEKRLDFSADLILSGDKKNLAHGALYVKDNLIKSDYGASKDNVKYFMDAIKKDADSLNERIKAVGEKSSRDFEALLNRATPYFKRIDEDFRAEWDRFYKEISVDKVFKELSHTLNEIVHYLAKIFDEVLQGTKPMMEQISKTFTETSNKMLEIYKQKLEKQLMQLYETIGKILKEYLDGIIDVIAHFSALFADFFEKYKPELQELTNVITEIFKDFTRIIVTQLKELPPKIANMYEEMIKQINSLPIIEIIKDKYKEGIPKEQITAFYNQAYTAIFQILPNKEFREFAEALNDYVLKKLRSDKVDDNKSLQIIYQKLIAAFGSLNKYIPSQITGYTTSGPSSFSSYLFSPTAPAWSGDSSWSMLKQILSEEAPDILSIIRAYRPRSVNPIDEMPAKLRAVVVNGQHIFTFDGRHLTFPGQCRYVLIHDHVDRNFTVLLQLQGGLPKALVLEDKSGTIIELKDNGQVTLNGAAHGFPVIEKDVFAFRQVNGRIGLGSRYGFMAFCTSKLEVCYFEVNGFYLGKLRGLLGDGNNEAYDDFRLPNGKITSSESEFGNSYALSRSCAPAHCPEHSHHQMHAALPPACEQVFGGTSPLRPISLLLDITPFRQACIHAVTGADAAKDLHQACDLARGYAALALTGLLPAILPDVCVQCTDADKPHAVGDTYEVKLPNKQADIVVTFETTQDNEKNFKDVVVPLVSQLIDNLKSKHITDIKLYLIGHTSKMPYPILYDTDLKLKSSKLHFDDKERYDRTPYIKTGYEVFDKYEKNVIELMDELRIKLGLTNIAFSMKSILDLPFRAGAVKHVIFTVGEPCIDEFFLLEVIGAAVFEVLTENMGMSLSLVTITPEMKCGGNLAHVVGFDESSVLMLGDKKRTKESEALRGTLELPSNSCIDFIEGVGGLVFSATNYMKLDGGQQKQFLQTAANAITQKMVKEQLIQECTCTYVDPFRVRSVCYTKDRKEVARRRK